MRISVPRALLLSSLLLSCCVSGSKHNDRSTVQSSKSATERGKATNQPAKSVTGHGKPAASNGRAAKTQQSKFSGGGCYKGDLVCEKDKLGYEAIATLHHQMDDDNNGDIDLEESAEFLLEELQYKQSHWADHRRKAFHMNDTHITVDDLWTIWKNSSVHNWTLEQTVAWLANEVELPQYVEAFKVNAVDGSTLPRLAVNNLNFVSNILGIKNLVHKQKLANKATDVVLFGPPKSRHNWYKDVALAVALVIAAGGCWFAYRQNKQLEINMARTLRDMDSLARSEVALKELQEKLENEELEKRRHIQHKEQLEEKIKREVSEARLEAQKLKLTKEQTETQLSQMKEMRAELERMRQTLVLAQKELDVRSSLTPSLELQRWLQITYELELKVYNEKHNMAEQQLLNAKESCERLRRKKQALFGSLRMAHSGYIDETEQKIITAKKALEEIKHDLAERQYRWQQIENICSFSIISNPGIKALIQSTGHTDLYRYCHGGTLLETGAIADLDEFEDMPPTYGAVVAAMQSNGYSLARHRRSNDSASRCGGAAGLSASQPLLCTMQGASTSKSSTTSRPAFRGLLQAHSPGGETSSRDGSEEPLSMPQSVASDEQSAQSYEEQFPGSAVESSHDSDSGHVKPKFGLYQEDQESSSGSSNVDNTTNIPQRDRTRPPLLRKSALRHTTDAGSVCSEQLAPSSVPDATPIRDRSQTSESLSELKRLKARAVSSPLAAQNTALSNSESVVANGVTHMRRSKTVDSAFGRGKLLSNDCPTKPDSAPASLGACLYDSDTSLSSGSKDNVSTDERKAKKKKNKFMNLFKAKHKTY